MNMIKLPFQKSSALFQETIFPQVFLSGSESLFLLLVSSELDSIQEQIYVCIYPCVQLMFSPHD